MGSKERRQREKDQLKNLREGEILQAAENLFLEKGFQKTTVGEIARACELTNGALYLYFKNKNEIILIIMARISQHFGDFFEEAYRGGSDGYDRVCRILKVYSATFRKFTAYHRLDAEFNALFIEDYPKTTWVETYFKENKRVLDILSRACEEGFLQGKIQFPGNLREKGGENLALLLLNAANSYVEKISRRRNIMEREQGINLEEELDSYLDLLISGITV